MELSKEDLQLQNRIRDLADKSFQQNIYTFTGFLGLSEQDIFWRTVSEIRYTKYELYGGSEQSERKMVRFGSEEDLGYEQEYPIVCIHIRPLMEKFADDLGHRDFLGALMNLGIERSTLGDIKILGKSAYLFCAESIAEYICEHLDKIKHTSVRCDVVSQTQEIPVEEPERMEVLLPSLRLDACLAKVYNKSRGDVIEYFRGRKVYVNGRLCENNAKQLKDGDVVNLRGFGKFVFYGDVWETKKGKLRASILIYR